MRVSVSFRVRIRFEHTPPDKPEPTIEASGGHNFERAEPRRIGFGGDDLPDRDAIEGKR